MIEAKFCRGEASPHAPAAFWSPRLIAVGLILAGATEAEPAGAANVGAEQSFRWEQAKGYRSAPLVVPKNGQAGFTRIPGDTSGILFTNELAVESGIRTQLRLAGSGVAAGDVNGDGWCDLYFCGMESGNRLYLNRGGWKFEEAAEASGVRCAGQYSTGAVFADVDGDGDLDLLVNSIGGGTRLFLNDGRGHFEEAADSGLVRKFGATSMALGDIDGNGTLDLYVANNNSPTALGDEPNTRFTLQVVDGKPVITAVNGRPVAGTELDGRYAVSPFDNSIREYGQADLLYLNDGHGHFSSQSWTDGRFKTEDGQALASAPRDLGLSAMFRDMNEDGAPDIYVCNDLFTPDRIWLNDGKGHFRAMPSLAVRNSSAFSMGVDFADINRDGHDDFLVTDMLFPSHKQRMLQTPHMTPVVIRAGEKNERSQLKRNVLQLNRGDGTYAEIAQLSGLEASAWSWATLFLDVDLDGYEDVIVASGYDRDSMNGDVDGAIMRKRQDGHLSADEIRHLGLLYPTVFSPIMAFRNLGDLRFLDMGKEWGFNWSGVNQGICCADLDNDGDLEVIVNCLHGPAGVYRNESSTPRVAVRLRGLGGNTGGIGAKIRLYGGATPMQSQEMICGGRYLSSDDAERVFAAGSETNRMRLEVVWRSGKRSVVPDVRANWIYEIEEAGADDGVASQSSSLAGTAPADNSKTHSPTHIWFEDVSLALNHVHTDTPFDDFARQPMLTRKLSQLGPGVTWTDLNGDGREDLLIPSGRGGQLEAFINSGNGSFQRLPLGALIGRAPDDEAAVVGWASGNTRGFFLAESNYETRGTNGVRRFEMWAGGLEKREWLPGGDASIGPLALGVFDETGASELFVGGRVIPGHWPAAASSKLFRINRGVFQIDEENSRRLSGIGMVSGAVWSDLDGDGYPELVLACEWGPLRLFKQEQGELRDVTKRWGMDSYTGWWNGVAVGDFDGDGRMDLVASNWGQNHRYERGRAQGHPLQVFYGDWNRDGTTQVIEAYFDLELNKIVPWHGLNSISRGMPSIRQRFPTHASFSEVSITDILEEQVANAKVLDAAWLETTVFLNRGDHFEPVVLPDEAQFAPAFGVAIGDLDGDGNQDIVLAQNFFEVDDETSRCDAGRGVLLRGDGHGRFEMVPGAVSGIRVYGDARGAALCDYDGDGRLDLAIAQNRGQTILYHNVAAKPGLRVELLGPPENPLGIGAVMRLRFGERWGAAQEVHAGSGYWSQDSPIQVLGEPEQPSALWVRWPGGKVQQVNIPPGARELKVRFAAE